MSGGSEGEGGTESAQRAIWHRAGARGPLDITSVLIAGSSVQYQLSQGFLSQTLLLLEPY